MAHRLISNGDIILTGPVGFLDWDGDGFTAREVIAALAEIEGDVTVKINSGGGFAFDGISIYNALRQHDGSVTTIATGIAASAASAIFMAGQTRIVADGAMLMIHDASGMTLGTEADHLLTAASLGKLSNSLAGIYAKGTGEDRDAIRADMKAELWLDAEDAVARGYATSEEGKAEEPSAFDYRIYAHAPKNLVKRAEGMAERFGLDAAAAAVTNRQPPKEVEMTDPTKAAGAAPKAEREPLTLADLKADHAEVYAEAKAEIEAAAQQAGAEAERARIKACQDALIDGADAAIVAMAYDGKSQAGDIALAIVKHAKAKGDQHLAALRAAEKDIDAAGLTATPVATTEPAAKKPANTPDGWKAEFEASEELQGEFTSGDAYVAFKKAEARGGARILSR